MAYFQKYYLEFTDAHPVNPIDYRIDILDSEGATPATPYKLTGARPALKTLRVNENEDKRAGVIGKEITLSYVYTGNPNEPLPDDFFNVSERRFRVEVRMNGTLDGIYYIKPDFSEFPDDTPPFVVSLKAADGLKYSEGVLFNAYNEDGSILYDRINLYEAFMARALLQVLDADTKLNVLNSLYPTNIAAGVKLFFGCYIHTDNFYDFADGPKSVYDVLQLFAITFRFRIFIEENIVWLQRVQDLTGDSFTIEQYIDGDTENDIAIDMVATAGPSHAFDVIPANGPANRSSKPAIKKVQYEADYRSINRVSNFDWRSIIDFEGGLNFEFWTDNVTGLARVGTGTSIDPYRAFLPYDAGNPGATYMQTIIPNTVAGPGPGVVGDKFEISFRWKVINVEAFKIQIIIQSNNPGSVHYLGSGGNWVSGVSSYIDLKRNKRKQEGSYTILADPLPTNIFGTLGYDITLRIYAPNPISDPIDTDGPLTPGVEIYPVKLGINNSSSISKITKATNQAEFSQVDDPADFYLFDNGDIFSANSLTVVPFLEQEVITNWDSAKPNVQPNDIEYHMTRSYVDQYARSVRSWEGVLYGNGLKFYQLLQLSHIPNKNYLIISDEYDNEDCMHKVVVLETLEEGNADIIYDEYDVNEEKD